MEKKEHTKRRRKIVNKQHRLQMKCITMLYFRNSFMLGLTKYSGENKYRMCYVFICAVNNSRNAHMSYMENVTNTNSRWFFFLFFFFLAIWNYTKMCRFAQNLIVTLPTIAIWFVLSENNSKF